ncbi:MAG: response regulator [Croceivirga sp.]
MEKKEKTAVIIIEDNVPLSQGFKKQIEQTETYQVSACYETCEAALTEIEEIRPSVIIMDIQLPGMSGVEGTKRIKAKWPQIDIIIATVDENSKTVFEALCAGATGYLTKNATSFQLISALNEVCAGGAPMSINIAKMVVQSFQKASSSILSERETEVLSLLASGKSYKSVGETMFISLNTIRFHIKNIYDKLQVKTREDAIRIANEQKLI